MHVASSCENSVLCILKITLEGNFYISLHSLACNCLDLCTINFILDLLNFYLIFIRLVLFSIKSYKQENVLRKHFINCILWHRLSMLFSFYDRFHCVHIRLISLYVLYLQHCLLFAVILPESKCSTNKVRTNNSSLKVRTVSRLS